MGRRLGSGLLRQNKVLAAIGSAMLVAALLAGVGLAAATPPDLPESGSAPGSRLAQIGLDSQGHATYGYVPIVQDEAPSEAVNDDCVRAVEKYRDELRARLTAETPYKYWKLAPAAVGYPTAVPPLVMDNVFVHLYATRDEIIPAMRAVLRVVLDYDPKLNLVGFVFHSSAAMYGEAHVYVSEAASIDWNGAARELQQQSHVKLGEQGFIAID
jgi:hypothetical protein